MPITNGHPVETGCVLSSPYGWHNHARMIATAVDLGFALDVAGQRDVDAYDTGEYTHESLTEIVMDIMDEAERWLNDHTPALCNDCGQPVELTDSGAWWVHISPFDRQACGTFFADTAQHYVWHWHDGEFFLSPLCDDEDTCTDETCAHWS